MPDWKDYIEMGVRALEEGDPEQADLYFSLAYDKGPQDDPTPPFMVGWRMARQDRFRSAEKYLREAWERDPSHLPSVCEWARVIARLGRRTEALDRIRSEIANHGETPLLLLTLAEILALSGEYGDAIDALYRARELGASDEEYSEALAKVYHAQAVAHLRHGRADDAYRLLLRVVELAPGWSSPYVNLGHIEHIRGEKEHAALLYRKALGLDPSNPVAIYNLALVCIELGEYGEAKELITRLLEEHRGYPGVDALVDRLLAGTSDGRGEDR